MTDLIETLRVRWFMLDAQKKQLLLVAAFYLTLSLLDIATGVAKHRLTKGTP